MNTSPAQAEHTAHAFTQEAREAIYHAIFSRRDVRGQYLPTPVSDAVLNVKEQPRRLKWSFVGSTSVDHGGLKPALQGHGLRPSSS